MRRHLDRGLSGPALAGSARNRASGGVLVPQRKVHPKLRNPGPEATASRTFVTTTGAIVMAARGRDPDSPSWSRWIR